MVKLWRSLPHNRGAATAVNPDIMFSQNHADAEKDAAGVNTTANAGATHFNGDHYADHVADNAGEKIEDGVKKAEDLTRVWSRRTLILTYACIYLVFFVNSLQQQITGNLNAYVTSAFAEHSLTSTTNIVSGIVGGVAKLPTAKLINLWGRAEGFALMVFFTTIGLVMMAVCTNVQTYAAAQMFYWVGFNGMSYVLDVIIADTSSLKNRALMFAFTTTPYIVTTFAGPRAASAFYYQSSWRWAFGAFAIITPAMTAPIMCVLIYEQRKARKTGRSQVRESSGRSFLQSVMHYLVEFDVVGIILICAGWILVLLPFSLQSLKPKGWADPEIIVMLVLGFVCLIVFAVWEAFFAPSSFIPFHVLSDRTVIGACTVAAIFFVSFYCWDSYFSSFLQVVYGVSISNAGYIANIYSIGSCFWSVVVGLTVRRSGRIKWQANYFAMPLLILACGLMIHFRQPGQQNLGFTIMCQVFIAFGGGTLVLCEEMAVMAAASQENVASLLALIGLFYSIGGGIGSAISGAIWTSTLRWQLYEGLEPLGQANLTDAIYGDLATQLSYPMGSATRDVIIDAYGVVQRDMAIAATVAIVCAWPFVWMWRDYRIKEIKQVQGTVV